MITLVPEINNNNIMGSTEGIGTRIVRLEVEGQGKVTMDPGVVRTLSSVKGAVTLLNGGFIGLQQGSIFALPGDKETVVRVDRGLNLELEVVSGFSDDDIRAAIVDSGHITLKSVMAVVEGAEGGE